jgi:tetratricopeptide (TPR) repeat protein
VRQPAPRRELPGLEPDTVDVDLWSRVKLDYEQHCSSYKQADVLVRRQLRGLAEAIIGDSMRDKVEGAKAAVPNAVAPTDSGIVVPDTAAAPTVVGPTSTGTVSVSGPPVDAKFYRESAIAAYRNGDLALALVDFDKAIRLDPSFEDAYIDRSIVLYRLGALDFAFDDVARARRIENSHRVLTPPLPKASPLSNKN